MNSSRRLTRSNTDRIIGGVAGGIANYLNVDPTLVRLGFVLLVLVGGVSPFIYLILWAVLPNESAANANFADALRQNIADMQQSATQVVSKVSDQVNQFVGKEQHVGQNAGLTTPDHQDNGPATGPTTRL